VHEVLGAPMTNGASFAERYAQYWRLPASEPPPRPRRRDHVNVDDSGEN
jgi:hypothetical protein